MFKLTFYRSGPVHDETATAYARTVAVEDKILYLDDRAYALHADRAWNVYGDHTRWTGLRVENVQPGEA